MRRKQVPLADLLVAAACFVVIRYVQLSFTLDAFQKGDGSVLCRFGHSVDQRGGADLVLVVFGRRGRMLNAFGALGARA